MSAPRPSWRPLLAGTVGLFLVILAFLAGQVKAGGDPALSTGNAATKQAQDAQRGQQTAPPGYGGGQGAAPDSSLPDDGFVPGGSSPAPPVP
jgi:hypothetical protein